MFNFFSFCLFVCSSAFGDGSFGCNAVKKIIGDFQYAVFYAFLVIVFIEFIENTTV